VKSESKRHVCHLHLQKANNKETFQQKALNIMGDNFEMDVRKCVMKG